VSIATKAMRLGAVEVLEKPVLSDRLLNAVKQGFEQAIAAKQFGQLRREVQESVRILTAKERIVLQCLLDGLSMKEISLLCECSIATVARFQVRVLEKMKTLNAAQLAIKMHRAEVSLLVTTS
jgi:two-component system, LuxR family, response regulator FixJ